MGSLWKKWKLRLRQATGGRVKPVDADLFKSKAGSTRQGCDGRGAEANE